MRFTHAISSAILLLAGCADAPPTPVTPQDLQTVTNIIRATTSDTILDVRIVTGSVIVDTGSNHVVLHYYHVERTKSGWKITDHGS